MKTHYPYFKTLERTNSPFLPQVLQWAQSFRYNCILEHNDIAYPFSPFERLIAVSNKPSLPFGESKQHLETLEKHLQREQWLFGFLSYDLKNELEDLHTTAPPHQGLPLAFFFEPETLLRIFPDRVEIFSQFPCDELWETIQHINLPKQVAPMWARPIKALTDRESYIADVQHIQQHIEEGDVYELNYCMAYESEGQAINPLATFLRLNEYSPMPFASFFKIDQQYVLCASPERFLKKQGKQLISQPIKGTVRRGKDASEDEQLKSHLFMDEKERAENMMIVDLVRNDLAKVAHTGSVQVAEMFGIYTFKQLHQMISTVTAEALPSLKTTDILSAAFPMGSMTGAPKVMAMQLIDRYEKVGRGLFSGAIGYFTPSQDFDFNVVIRTLFYDAAKQKISFQVGSAITYDADAIREYEECLLKSAGILKAIGYDKAI